MLPQRVSKPGRRLGSFAAFLLASPLAEGCPLQCETCPQWLLLAPLVVDSGFSVGLFAVFFIPSLSRAT